MTNWARERWRRLYLREPLEQEAWPWYARGLRNLLIQRAQDDGFVARSVARLRDALRGDEQLEESVELMLDDGFLVETEEGLYVRNLPAAQLDDEPDNDRDDEEAPENETPSARRKRLARLRAKRSRASRSKRDTGAPERDSERDSLRTQSVTERDGVTPPPSPLASPLPPPASQTSQNNQHNHPIRNAHARDGERDAERTESVTGSVTQSVTERDALALDYVTECPVLLVELCTERGLMRSLAAEHHVPDADVIQAVVDYRDHFTKGGGFGEKRKFWGSQVRRRVLALAKGGQLRGLGGGQSGEPDKPRRPPPVADHTRRPVEMGPPVTLVPRPQRKATEEPASAKPEAAGG